MEVPIKNIISKCPDICDFAMVTLSVGNTVVGVIVTESEMAIIVCPGNHLSVVNLIAIIGVHDLGLKHWGANYTMECYTVHHGVVHHGVYTMEWYTMLYPDITEILGGLCHG